MKKLLIIATFMLVGILPMTLFGQHTTDKNIQQIPGETLIQAERAVTGLNVLVIRDVLPWSDDVTVPVLNSLGATVSTATSVSMVALDFSVYDKIVIESVQGSSFYTAFEANMTKFETYVSGGGVLQVNACTHSISFMLPGGAQSVEQRDNDGKHVAIGHPMLVGVPDPFFGDWANHNIITSLPAGTQIITANLSDEPTTVIYNMGSGVVIASGLTLEIAYDYENNGSGIFNFGLAMYPNMLDYTDGVGPQPVPVSNWAIILGVLMIGTFIVIRYRRERLA